MATAVVTVPVQPPVNTSPPTISGQTVVGDTLTAANGSWSNGPTGYSYQWQDCDSSGANCGSISGATSSSYKLASSDAGGTIDVVVTASNSAGSGQATSAATSVVTVPVQPPVNTSPPTIGGTAAVGDTLTAGNGSWSNGPTGYSYQWQDCNSSGANCSSISGATGSSYKLASGDAGDTIDVVVTASNSGGSASASSAATGVVVAGSGGTLPSGVSLQAIDGGSSYYCSHGFTQACNDGWDSPSFFPIGPFWGNYAGEQSTWSAVDWNTEFYTTSQTDTNDLANDGRFIIPAGSASITPNNNTVGYDSADEPGSWSSATSPLANVSNANQDSRFWYVNDTWEFAQSGAPSGTPGGTRADFFTDPVSTPDGSTRHLDMGSIDTYWFSVANDSQYPWSSAGGQLYNGGGYGQNALTTAETKCGCRYGDMIRPVFGTTVGLPAGKDQASWHTTYPGPIFQYVEDSNIGNPGDVPITPPEMNWAVWSSIIHGARGLIYFDHALGGSCVSDNYITTSCAHSDYSGQSTSIYSQMIATDSAVESLAPEINSETALGYETVSPAPTTFGGVETRAVWDTNSSDCNGQAPCFYIFADTRDAESASNVNATFTTVGNYSGAIPVVGESRTVTATNGAFSDTFAQGSTVHIYGPIPNQ